MSCQVCATCTVGLEGDTIRDRIGSALARRRLTPGTLLTAGDLARMAGIGQCERHLDAAIAEIVAEGRLGRGYILYSTAGESRFGSDEAALIDTTGSVTDPATGEVIPRWRAKLAAVLEVLGEPDPEPGSP
ncbi:hypothetical protein LAZ40_06765 [Cereibacter sphaeroides]|uniref:hypothetical protein n=1 Tax=Cereibacter sphaeroides TaxID=1063 RepID=UPI001F1CD797|nr:hypothetical protein [Cereibacter sphaeroides]MCE6958748.1 hypothetical protein [Cereibacter sphaeroides]MCE6973378.1 hypothetical protein [Cereibacter sphaeroides]